MTGKLQHILFLLIVVLTFSIVAIIGLRIKSYEPGTCVPDHYEMGSIVLLTFNNAFPNPFDNADFDYTGPCESGSYIIPVDLIILDIIVIAGFGMVVIKRRKTIIEQEFKRK